MTGGSHQPTTTIILKNDLCNKCKANTNFSPTSQFSSMANNYQAAKGIIKQNEDRQTQLSKMPTGVYIFGP